MEKSLIPILMALAIFAILFIVLREFICWYYKINEKIKLMKELNENIKLLVQANGKTPYELPNEKTPWWKDKPEEKKED